MDKLKQYFSGFWFSMPVQLLLLHFRRYQVFLVFWYVLFSTVAGGFMRTFGADSLFLAPEYFGKINVLSTAIVGFALGIFIMSWNITTFILFSKYFRFLATTAQPFLKYCINNAVLPVIFLVFYFSKAVSYARYQELFGATEISWMVLGFAGGIITSILIAFAYFFGADKTIYRSMASVIDTANVHYALVSKNNPLPKERTELRIDWFFSAKMALRKPRDVRHYSLAFLDTVFKRHHFAAVIAIAIAFFFLIGIGYISDTRLFQLPAAASITVFFAILIAAAGAISTFLHSWSIPVMVLVYLFVNFLYQKDIIDLRNKAYGLDYSSKTVRPVYSRESVMHQAGSAEIAADKQVYINMLNQWKKKQGTTKPVMYLINTSGGGIRSATFTMNALQQLDSMFGGKLLQQTFLISGASGGMLGAAYFRELYYRKQKGEKINLQDKQYIDDISNDLLNPLFSSFVTRDLIGPAKPFTKHGYSYTKDRGYAFEQKLNENTHGYLNRTLNDYKEPEAKAEIPLIFFNAVITRDGRKLVMATHPARFMTRPLTDSTSILPFDADAIDFRSFFDKQNAGNIGVLSALRMNATFPYVLPNVWLPTNPVIDVMDAGLRDNFGQETSLRFIEVFRDWLKENTSKVVLLQLRDRSLSDWDRPLEGTSLFGTFTKPFLLLQNNWYKLQDYYQHDQLAFSFEAYGPQFHRICFQYVPSRKEAPASLSFHITAAEKRDIALALKAEDNRKEFKRLRSLMK
ncbi:patatin-like phospholipase family protein [Sediminibacterium goheungense]|uniref:Patatin-like phospholipase n=1 Tax=Sediminibacterium goheungense TaxID=1086393 RepID=A0A4R6IW79_9BACT|nr:patatin-like phospholipase family protein [Sediminibacterium goheungense]TDO26591.1 patatin-like phospholipase [Sediminibacterium goheungense]